MNIFLNEDELEEVKPVCESEDRALVIPDNTGKRGEAVSDLVKEITAIDAINIGPTKAAEINGVPESSASKYSNGMDISNPDTSARVIAHKFQIQDTAVAKLMQTLNLVQPERLETVKSQMLVINGLSQLVERIAPKEKEGPQQVHLHLYAPNQKKESEYEIIDA